MAITHSLSVKQELVMPQPCVGEAQCSKKAWIMLFWLLRSRGKHASQRALLGRGVIDKVVTPGFQCG